MSFKVGSGEGWRDGPYSADYDEERAGRLLARHVRLSGIRLWRSLDPVPGIVWLNVLAQRVSSR